MLVKMMMIFFGGLEFLLCFCLNAYIMVAHLMSLRSGLKLSPCDLIQLVMAVTNLSGQMFALLQSTVLWLPVSDSHLENMYHLVGMMIPCHIYFSYWLVAFLCAHYCTSIANSRLRAFIWVKRVLPSVTSGLILLSAMGSFIINLHFIWNLHVKITTENCTRCSILPEIEISYKDPRLNVTSLGYILPFFIILVSLVVSVSSLIRHIRNAKQNNMALTHAKLQAHVSAVRTMVLLLLLSIVLCMISIVMFSAWINPQVQGVISWILLLAPSAEAAIIIQSSPKLRKMLPEGICAGMCHTNNNPH